MRCSYCGCENEDSAKFCKKCGNKLDSIKEKHSAAYQDLSSKNSSFNENSSKNGTNKVLIISIIIVLLVAGAAAGFILMQPHYKEINLVGVSMEVPDSEYNVTIRSNSLNTYMDEDNHIVAYGYDSTDADFSKLGEAIEFAAIRDLFSTNTKSITVDGVSLNKSTNGTYSYTNYYGHKNIVLISTDKNTLAHMVKSIKVSESSNVNPTQDTNQSQNPGTNSGELEILGGDISTGSSLSAKTKAHIFVGTQHAGETVKITAKYSRDGTSLNNGNILSRTVDSEGYVSFNSAEAFKKYPDTAIIELYNSDGSLADTETVTLSPSEGTQSF